MIGQASTILRSILKHALIDHMYVCILLCLKPQHYFYISIFVPIDNMRFKILIIGFIGPSRHVLEI